MAAALPILSQRARQPAGCCAAPVQPDLDAVAARELAAVVKALADPTRLRIVDCLRKATPEAICQCELTPIFAMSQPALAKHLKILVAAGVVGNERRGLWTFYFLPADSRIEDVIAWLS